MSKTQSIAVQASPEVQALFAILALLPERFSSAVHAAIQKHGIGFPHLQELRLRRARASSLTVGGRNILLSVCLTSEELRCAFRSLAGGSVYAVAGAISHGYLPLPHGFRAGAVGRAVCENGRILSVADIDSIVIRVPHAVTDAAVLTERLFRLHHKGILIFSPPGIGKTTALRYLAKALSCGKDAFRVVVIDEREEFAPLASLADAQLDLLRGYPKADGLLLAARTLSPELMIADEIGSDAECRALLSVALLGVPMIASAHAAEAHELFVRPSMRALLESGVFPYLVGLTRTEEGQVVERVYETAAVTL